MTDLKQHIANITNNGFTIIDNIYSETALNEIGQTITEADTSNLTFRKSSDLFAIRQLFKEIPGVKSLVLTNNLTDIIRRLFGTEYFVVKSIYFDKPELSNWFVAWHQDLTISVDKKTNLPGYSSWTKKQNQFAVQPPLYILENNFTIRIHLDDTDENNGALKVLPGSHLKGIRRNEEVDYQNEPEHICGVNAGGVMIMKPLLFHSSNRTTNSQRRRVIHIEFSKEKLPDGINWGETN